MGFPIRPKALAESLPAAGETFGHVGGSVGRPGIAQFGDRLFTSERTVGRRQQITAVARAVGLRLALWGGLTIVALVAIGDFGWLLRPAPSGGESAQEPGLLAEGFDWPHHRGPHYNSVSDETGLADSWPPSGPPLLWRTKIGRGYSGMIAVGDRVYTQTQTLSGQSVVCMEADTGRPIWEHQYGWPYEAAGMYPGPRATPSWHSGRVYFAAPDGLVGALTARDGRLLWSVNVNQKFAGRGTGFGYSSIPLVEDGKVILPVGGPGASVVALDALTGSTVWASGDELASYSSVIPIQLGGRRRIVALLQNALTVLDPDTGQILWKRRYSTGYDEHSTLPLYEEPYLMVARPFRHGAEAYRLEVPETDSGEASPKLAVKVVWQGNQMSNDVASSVLVDGHVYGFDLRDVQARAHRPSRGEFKCLELATGKVLWSTARPGHASVIAADGKLILFNDCGEAILARVSPAGYVELGRTQVFRDEICWTAPALARGRLYLRSPSSVACLDVGRPQGLDTRQLAPANAAGEVRRAAPRNLMALVGKEREYPFDPPDLEELVRWYGWSTAILLAAAAVAGLLQAMVRFGWPERTTWTGRAAFWCSAMLLGAVATPAINRSSEEFVFTWPVCVFAIHQLTLTAIVGAGRQPDRSGPRWVSVAALGAMVAICLFYFLASRRLGLAVTWVFLVGLAPSWPVAVPAAYRLSRPGNLWRDAAWAMVSFTAYFWVSGAFSLVRESWRLVR